MRGTEPPRQGRQIGGPVEEPAEGIGNQRSRAFGAVDLARFHLVPRRTGQSFKDFPGRKPGQKIGHGLPLGLK